MSTTIKTTLFIAVLGLILFIVAVIRNPNDSAGPAMFSFAFCGLPGFYALYAWYQIRKLKNLSFQQNVVEAKTVTVSQTFSNDAQSNTIAFKEKEFPELKMITRPRELRMTWKGRSYFAIALLALGLYTFYGLPATWREFSNPGSRHLRDWTLAIPMVLVYGYCVVFFRNRLRERHLLADGEIAAGYVIAQDNERYTQSIQYCFSPGGGKLVTNRCTDASRRLYEGMTVPVFYDVDNPKDSIPLDCSLTKVVGA